MTDLTTTTAASNAALEAVAPPADIEREELDRDERENSKMLAQKFADEAIARTRNSVFCYTGAESLARKCAAI